jgi:hypothetical protein
LEIFKWTGQAAFEPIFKELKPVQVKELTDSFTSVTEKPVQTRFLRSQVSEQTSNEDDVQREGELCYLRFVFCWWFLN